MRWSLFPPILALAQTALGAQVVQVTTRADVVNSRDRVISLREAIDIANKNGGDTVIELAPHAVYRLRLCAAVTEDNNASGDLDYTGEAALTVRGHGAFIVNTCPRERVLQGVSASGSMNLFGLSLRGGDVTARGEAGGGILAAGELAVKRVAVSTNAATAGGGIFGAQTVTLERAVVNDNVGGGVSALPGSTLVISESAIRENGGDGVALDGGSVRVSSTEVSGNAGRGIGLTGATLLLENVRVCDNGGGGVGTSDDVLHVKDALVQKNGGFGGINCVGCREVRVSDSTIIDNAAEIGRGGGIGIVAVEPSAPPALVVRLVRVLVDNNSAPDGGGGVAVTAAAPFVGALVPSLVILDSRISRNSTGFIGPGGGVYVDVGDLSIRRSLLSDNLAGERGTAVGAGLGGPGGGVLFRSAGTLDVSATTLRNNVADGDGGGISAGIGSTATLVHVVFADNDAAFGVGGGFASAGDAASLTESWLHGNTAAISGGGLSFVNASAFGGTLEIVRSTVNGNDARLGGGGIVVNQPGSRTHIDNSTIDENSAVVTGGGIQVLRDGALDLVNVTITENTAPDGGNVNIAVGEFTTFGSVIALADGGADCAIFSGVTNSLGYNADGDGTCRLGGGPGDLPALGDPGLGALSDNGGPTPTRAPLPGSPLISVIPVAACAPVPIDQRGVTRPQGPACDTGSVEVP